MRGGLSNARSRAGPTKICDVNAGRPIMSLRLPCLVSGSLTPIGKTLVLLQVLNNRHQDLIGEGPMSRS
jgi:hypothetical protein